MPVQTRIVQGEGYNFSDYSIQVGENTYYAPDCVTTPPNYSGFQVLVLDQTTLAFKDHRSFPVPSEEPLMWNFLSGLDDSSLFIISSLYNAAPVDVCGGNPLCPLGTMLEEFGATEIFTSNFDASLSYYLPKMTTPTNFSYSLIGIKGLGQNQGFELNDWDHKVIRLDSTVNKIYSNISGYFVQDVNDQWTFIYPESVEIETRTGTSTTSNTITVGVVSSPSDTLESGAEGGFQVLVMDLDFDPSLPYEYQYKQSYTFSTNSGTGPGSVSDDQQYQMYSILNALLSSDPQQRFLVIIASIGNPIDYKGGIFTELAEMIQTRYGGSMGAFNQLGVSSTTYSLVGMMTPQFSYPPGASNTVEASTSGVNLRVVLRKDKQGWFEPVIINPGNEGETGGPDLSILSVALQPYTPWPLPDPNDSAYEEQLAAYEYISQNLGEGTSQNPVTDIRSRYVGGDADKWLTYCSELHYATIPETEKSNFSEAVFTKMQVTSGSTLDSIYSAVKPLVGASEDSNIFYDAGIVTRGLLTAGGSIVPNPGAKVIMGTINGMLLVALGLSKNSGGADYTSLDTAFSSLETEMNQLWSNLPTGKDKVIEIILSDWGKLEYVAEKLTTEEQYGGWRYLPEDREDWVDQVTNTLEAYYFQSLLTAVWKIDYMWNQTDSRYPATPKNFYYYGPNGSLYPCELYCGAPGDPNPAYWVDVFGSIYFWYVLEDEIHEKWTDGCGNVDFSRSTDLRDVLFGEGAWEGGQKLNLDPYVFYEKWLPSAVYGGPKTPDGIDACYMYGGTGCNYGAECN